MELGDLVDAAPTVDEELGFLKSINGILRKMDRPCHYVLGNHCVATLTKEEFLKEVQQPKSYYSFDLHGFHTGGTILNGLIPTYHQQRWNGWRKI